MWYEDEYRMALRVEALLGGKTMALLGESSPDELIEWDQARYNFGERWADNMFEPFTYDPEDIFWGMGQRQHPCLPVNSCLWEVLL